MTAERRGERYLRFERETRAASWVIYLACAVWVVYVGATRWNGVPSAFTVGTEGPTLPIDPDLDRTRELVAALEALPPKPPLSYPPAPEGMEWTPTPARWDLWLVLNGEWSPATRPDQYTAIQQFQKPEVTRALDKLVAVQPGAWRAAGPGLLGIREATKRLVARARYHHAERGDVDAALADLVAIFRLAGINYRSRDALGILVAAGIEGAALGELRRLSRERSLTREQASHVLSAIRELLPGHEERWALIIDARVGPMLQAIDGCYTPNTEGGGWLVLSRLDDALATPQWQGLRAGAWNALSVVFNGREVVSAKIDTVRAFYEAALGMPYADALEALDMPVARQDFNLLDGPLNETGLSRSYAKSTFRGVQVGTSAEENVTGVAVALSVFQHEHGEYPATLGELVPAYIETMPLDPFVDEPFRYRQKDDGSYLLYSVFHDQIDDGGVHCWDLPQGSGLEHCDCVYSRPRSEPRVQFLVEKGEDG